MCIRDRYTVTLMVTDTNQCYSPDSIEFIVNIGDFQGGVIDPDILVCPGQTAQLEAYGGAVYQWSPAAFLSNATIANPIATVTQSTLFTCIISDSCGIDTVQVQVTVSGGNVIASADTSICLGNSVPLFVQGVLNATWSPPSFLDNPNSLTPISTPLNTITYQITGQTIDGCSLNESVTIQVFFNPPIPVIPDTLKYCAGGSGTVTVSGATSYAWSPPTAITPLTGPTVTISAVTEGYYYCDFTNVCGTVRDSIFISLVDPSIFAGDDTIVCPGEVAYMHAWGGVSYVWYPAVTALTANGSEVSVIAPNASTYKVIGSDQFGCIDSAYVVIDLFPKPFIQTNPDVYAIFGEPVPLSANSTTTGSYVWSPAEYLSCVVCDNPIAQPDRNFVYTVSYTDENGCSASDQVHIYYEPLIYVPNTFTPNGDNINEDFFALGVNIDDFTIDIFNRWGELIYTGDKLSKFWDGTYKGQNCQDGVYTWKIRYTEFQTDIVYELVGHVSLLR
jgi:gliding motility-associated-like protein